MWIDENISGKLSTESGQKDSTARKTSDGRADR
jgi:hypothetical protein